MRMTLRAPASSCDFDFRLGFALPDVLERHLHPAFTSRALGRDPPGWRVHPDDRVANDDLLGTAHEEGDPASRAAAPVLGDLDG